MSTMHLKRADLLRIQPAYSIRDGGCGPARKSGSMAAISTYLPSSIDSLAKTGATIYVDSRYRTFNEIHDSGNSHRPRIYFRRHLPEERLVAVERSHRLAVLFLRERFPKASIISADAVELDQIFAGMKFGGVFSSLPLKVFTDQQVERISAAIRHVMLPGGHWVQYSYQITSVRQI